jgi:hypothetical protein
VLANVLAAVALVLLAWDSDGNLWLAVAILIPMAMILYGTALIRWWASRARQPGERSSQE